jgi:GMP synthase (glutamine-hydrolysing)
MSTWSPSGENVLHSAVRDADSNTPTLRRLEVLLLQHTVHEPPGVYEEVLREAGARIHRVELDEQEQLPEVLSDFDAIIAMGGPMSVNDRQRYPWLNDELVALAAAQAAGIPVLGVCLGAQLLAASLGARAYRGDCPEVAVSPVTLSADARNDVVFSVLPPKFPALHWHSDTFELPKDAIWLARSDLYPNQAFRVGALSYGLQFHLEVTRSMLDTVAAEIPEYTGALEAAGGVRDDSLSALLAAFDVMADEMNELGRKFFRSWLSRVAPSRLRIAPSVPLSLADDAR